MRGHVNYKPVSKVEDAIKYQDPNSFLDMTGQKGQKILERTSILIPISISYSVIGCYFECKAIVNEVELRNAVNDDLDNVRALWATVIMSSTKKSVKLVPNLESYMFESPFSCNIKR